MHKSIGVASKMFSILSRNNINIEMISQGASEINISIVINKLDSDNALRLVHDYCILGICKN
jgi:aspartate kinase